MKKRIRFTVKPDLDKRWYYDVFLFTDLEEMRAFADKGTRRGKGWAKDALAVAHRQEVLVFPGRDGKKWSVKSRLGWVVFWIPKVGAGIVSHEFTHAALYYVTKGRRRGTDLFSMKKVDEPMAWAQGCMVHQFWQKYYKHYPPTFRTRLKKKEAA